MDKSEPSTSFSSNSSPIKKLNTDVNSDEEGCRIIDENEQDSELGVAGVGDNIDDSKEDEGDYEDVDYGDEEREVEEAEEPVGDDARLPLDRSHMAEDAFDNFEFVRQDDIAASSISFTEAVPIPEASSWLEGDKLYTAHIHRDRHFVCIDYPGVIQNQDKALATLGGLEELSKVVSEDMKLELTFRPNDPYCKTTVGSFTYSNNLLLKVKRRRKTALEDSSADGDGFEYQVEIIGTVDKVYVFDKLCDFQYLPVTKMTDGSYKEILSSVRPDIKDDRSEYLSRCIPLFLPPFSFSRRELPVSYSFDTEPVQPGEQPSDNYIGIDRKKRLCGTIHISFGQPEVPKSPDPFAVQLLKKLPSHERGLGVLQQIFEKRPLWSKVGIMANLDPAYHNNLKYLLPMVSFYFINGPWKNLWCKMGYDPRKDPSAKIYQTLDYRVRSTANRQKVESKRGLELRSFQYGLKQKTSATLIETDVFGTLKTGSAPPVDITYIFTQDHIPPYRQMRYQVCDVHHQEVQRLVHENDGQETTCTERDGWCVQDFTDVCRDLISASVEKLFLK